eukprot:UN30416
MLQSSNWKSLTSTPYDMEKAILLFGDKFGFKHYSFMNLTGEQMNALSKLIAATLRKNPETILLFHFSGHGGHLKAKPHLKLCFMGTDANNKGAGCMSLLTSLNREGVNKAFCNYHSR